MSRCYLILSRLILMIGFFCITIPTISVAAESRQTLVLGGPIFPNGWMYGEDGKVTGLRPELFNKIAQHAGYSWRGKLFPAKRLMASLAYGEVDISMLVLNPMLNNPELFLTGKDPIYTENLNLYSRSITLEASFRSDLVGKKIVVMRGYGYGGFKQWLDTPENQITQIEADSFAQAISILANRNFDYALLYDLNFQAGINELEAKKKNRLLKAAREFNVTRWAKVPVYFHLSRKALPDAEQILTKLMTSFRDLQHEGILPQVESMEIPGDRP